MPDAQGSTIESSQGNGGFTFGTATFKITSLDVSATAAQTDVSHLGLAVNAKRILKKSPLNDSPEVKIDFIGNSLPAVGTKNTFVLTGSFASTKAGDCTKAICTQASLKAAVGEIIKGSATFKLSKT
jgi:hypothetical protein